MAGATGDAQLMTRYATGDIAAFEALYARHKGPLYRYFLRQCGNANSANELFQEVWVRIIQARERDEPKSRFTTYVYQIAHNGLVEYCRKAGRSPVDGTTAVARSPEPEGIPDPITESSDPAFASARWSLVDWEQGPGDSSPGPGAASSGEQRAARLRSALDALPIEQRDAFLLHEEAEIGIADIATVTGANAETVKSRLRYAVNRLQSALGDLAPATPRGDAELEAFLARQSSLSTDYDSLERVQAPMPLDQNILAAAKAAAKPAVTKPAPSLATSVPLPSPMSAAGASSAMPPNPVERRKRPRAPVPTTDDAEPASRRPRWLVPAALAALVAVGVGLTLFMKSPSGTSGSRLDGSLFAKRARERGEAGKAAAAATAEQEAEVVVLDADPLPPPPVFAPEGPQVQDLDAAIALIRKELLRANQAAAVVEEAAGKLADTASPAAPAAPPSVIQPRDRRLTKILEIYDGGNPNLAADSLEIFLRDFEDDPISQRILAIKP